MVHKASKFYQFMPLLHVDIAIPFFEVRTVLMQDRLDCFTIEYVSFDIRLWKWRFSISLYTTRKRIQERIQRWKDQRLVTRLYVAKHGKGEE
jgi:hypothetical protein